MGRRGSLRIEISGGFGPVPARTLEWSVPLAELTKAELAGLDEALSTTTVERPSTDARTYRLQVIRRGQPTRTATLSDVTLPAGLRALAGRAVSSTLHGR